MLSFSFSSSLVAVGSSVLEEPRRKQREVTICTEAQSHVALPHPFPIQDLTTAFSVLQGTRSDVWLEESATSTFAVSIIPVEPNLLLQLR